MTSGYFLPECEFSLTRSFNFSIAIRGIRLRMFGNVSFFLPYKGTYVSFTDGDVREAYPKLAQSALPTAPQLGTNGPAGQ
jgi:hypothetical protein